jgi:hypothetical protein
MLTFTEPIFCINCSCSRELLMSNSALICALATICMFLVSVASALHCLCYEVYMYYRKQRCLLQSQVTHIIAHSSAQLLISCCNLLHTLRVHCVCVHACIQQQWWAHCRPHSSGHQLHFDSDDEGRGSVRNPIISTVLHLSEDEVSACSAKVCESLAVLMIDLHSSTRCSCGRNCAAL